VIDIFKWFGDIKIREKFLLIITVLVLLTIGFEIQSRRLPYSAYDEQLYEKTLQILSTYSNHMESEFNKMEAITYLIIGDPFVQDHLATLRGESVGSKGWVEARVRLYDIIENHSLNNPFFQSLKLLTRDVDIGASNAVFAVSAEQKAAWMERAAAAGGGMLLLDDGAGLVLIREIRQIRQLELSTLGVIAVKIDFSALNETCGQSFEKAGLALDVDIYRDGALLYASHPEKPALSFERDGWRVENDMFAVGYTSQKLGLAFVVSVSYDGVYKSIRAADRLSLLLTALAIAVAALLSALLVNSIAKGLTLLVVRMDGFRDGAALRDESTLRNGAAQDERLFARYSSRKDEIGRLHWHFGRMSVDYQALMEKHYESQLLLKESQFRHLQQQIQPHFLFNALSSISWIAYANKIDEAARIAESLGRILRATIGRSEKIVTVRSELDMLEDYIFIQKARYGDRLVVDIDVDDEILGAPIPPMTLQPLVENAIIHGLEEILEPCAIRLAGRAAGGRAELVVANSGPPIDTEILEKVGSGAVKAKGMGIGLNNINARIKLAFSEEYGLEFRNGGGFASVIVKIPKGPEEGAARERSA
jgi:two-component system sensor histidine kinase YesM